MSVALITKENMVDVAIATPDFFAIDRESFEAALEQCFDVNELKGTYKAIAVKRGLSKVEKHYRKSVIDKKITDLEKAKTSEGLCLSDSFQEQGHITEEGADPSRSPKETKPKLLDDAPIAVVLFAGGGGVEAGMVAAGIRPVISVELDPEREELSDRIIEVHEANFAEYGTKVVKKTVQQVAVEGFEGFPRNPDYLHSSNVCKNFSNAKGSKKGETEEDIDCAIATAVAIRELQPKSFTLEQVVGFKDSQSFKLILETLAEEGYTVKWDVVNFADYGVPQSRQRIVLRAGKDALIPLPPIDERVGWYEALVGNAAEGIAHLIPNMEDSELLPSQKFAVDAFLTENPLQQPLLIGRTGRSSDTLRTRNQGCFTLTAAIFTDQKLSNRSKFADIVLPGGVVKSLSIEAAARLQSFPDWYQFPEDVAISGTIIGNSVPPLFAFKLFSQMPVEKPSTGKSIALVCYESEEQHKKYRNPMEWMWTAAIAQEEYESMSLGEKVQWAAKNIDWIESAFPFGKKIVIVGDEDFVKRFDKLDRKKYEVEILSAESCQIENEEVTSEPSVTKCQIENEEVTSEPSVTKCQIETTGNYLISMAQIKEDTGTQSRESLDAETVAEYLKLKAEGVIFPPITLFWDGEHYYIADGWHRYEMEKRWGSKEISAEVKPGNRRDAILYSCGANASHGLRRSLADTRKAVLTLLRDPEWSQWSNREIARQCSTNRNTVGRLRDSLSGESGQIEATVDNAAFVKVNRNGTTYTQKLSKEKFPRSVLISSDHPTKAGREAIAAARLEDGSYLVEGEATDPKYIVEIPKTPKPITSVQQEERAIASSNGLRTKGALLPECDRNDGIEPEEGLQAVLKNQAAINQLVEHQSAITYAQTMQLLDVLRVDLWSENDLKSLINKAQGQLKARLQNV